MIPGANGFRPSALAIILSLTGYAAVTPAAAQVPSAIQGIITDGGTGRPLDGASVVLEQGGQAIAGTVTNRDGFYLIVGVAPGQYTLRVSYIGYVQVEEALGIQPGQDQTVSVALEVSPVQLEEVVAAPEGGAARREMGRQAITPAQLALPPAPAGSGDVAMYLQTVPGVVAIGDRGGQLFIRGGTHTENLALVDGMVIYQPFHILGFFSAFPEDLVSSVDFYAGGFGARYNSRTSSVLDVRMRDGNRTGVVASGSASPFLTEAIAEGPAGSRGQFSWIAAVRRSVLEETAPTVLGQSQPLGFDSQFLKLTSFNDEGARCSLMLLRTADQGRMDPDDPVSRVGWKNLVGGGRCVHLFEGILRLLEVSMGVSTIRNEAVSRGAAELFSDLRRYQMDVNTTNLFRGVRFEAGYYLRLEEMEHHLGEVFGPQENSAYLWGAGMYGEVGVPLGRNLLVQPGIVVSLSEPRGVEPRLRAAWQPFGRESEEVTAAVGLYRQAVAGISDTRDASSVFVAWARVPGATATESFHAQLGWQQSIGSGVDWSIEGYHRSIRNVAVPIWSTEARFNTELALADGTVWGGDARLELRRSGFYGFLGYGYSWTEYEAAQNHFSIWFDELVQRYHPPHDRRHQVTSMASLDLGPYTLGARWQLGTGLPFTRPMGYDEAFDFRFTIQSITGNRGRTRLIVDRPYAARLPLTHRLDVSVQRSFDLSFGRLEAQAGAINVYDQTNIFYYDIFTHRRLDQLPLAPYASLRLEVD